MGVYGRCDPFSHEDLGLCAGARTGPGRLCTRNGVAVPTNLPKSPASACRQKITLRAPMWRSSRASAPHSKTVRQRSGLAATDEWRPGRRRATSPPAGERRQMVRYGQSAPEKGTCRHRRSVSAPALPTGCPRYCATLFEEGSSMIFSLTQSDAVPSCVSFSSCGLTLVPWCCCCRIQRCWRNSGFTSPRQFMALLDRISHIPREDSGRHGAHCARGNALLWGRADHRTLKPDMLIDRRTESFTAEFVPRQTALAGSSRALHPGAGNAFRASDGSIHQGFSGFLRFPGFPGSAEVTRHKQSTLGAHQMASHISGVLTSSKS